MRFPDKKFPIRLILHKNTARILAQKHVMKSAAVYPDLAIAYFQVWYMKMFPSSREPSGQEWMKVVSAACLADYKAAPFSMSSTTQPM
jgi:flagellar biosynthesis regulator FlbT